MRITPRLTQEVILITIAVLLVYDWLCLRYGEPRSTISEVVWDACNRHKLILILVLLLFWHLILGESRGE